MSTDALVTFLNRIPGVRVLGTSDPGADLWWVKLKIDIGSQFAWNVVQELGHVLNSVSVTEKLPTAFFPTSPPPYLNGGPTTYLAWMIEARDLSIDAAAVAGHLEQRLPRPVEDVTKWPRADE